MELVVRKSDLLRELQYFQGIVERKSTIPILANVLLEAAEGKVRLLATDLEVSLRSTCDASIAKGGALTLPAKKLFEIVKALPDTDVRIEQDGTNVKVAADVRSSDFATRAVRSGESIEMRGDRRRRLGTEGSGSVIDDTVASGPLTVAAARSGSGPTGVDPTG